MGIDATLTNGRCFFYGFTPDNDKNPITGKAGVNYCRYQFIGAIFSLLGLTLNVSCRINNKPVSCYVYKKSFKNWVKNHENDLSISFDKQKKINNLIAEQYIKTIYENFNKKATEAISHQGKTCKPLSYEKVLEKAEIEFNGHQYQKEILEKIQKRLIGYSYKENLEQGIQPRFSDGRNGYDEFRNRYERTEKDEEVSIISYQFLNSLPGIDITPYDGLYLHSL